MPQEVHTHSNTHTQLEKAYQNKHTAKLPAFCFNFPVLSMSISILNSIKFYLDEWLYKGQGKN